eukprot:TRINITY_DN4933_c0_g4_i1.p1 TRINITY_DN4933_c0_g4~~TRINITY_DN4933_c0_g4_i1.p1  ORF type:complete len:127 (+),score=13.25 TRINITY_DN4933_c0_g4_i1:542-922(+)
MTVTEVGLKLNLSKSSALPAQGHELTVEERRLLMKLGFMLAGEREGGRSRWPCGESVRAGAAAVHGSAQWLSLFQATWRASLGRRATAHGLTSSARLCLLVAGLPSAAASLRRSAHDTGLSAGAAE